MAFLASLVDDLALDEAVAVSRKIEPRLRRDFLKELPLELALHCMSFVSPPHITLE
jgi:F-box and WD-40 domain protein CDC4